jgi:glucosamine-6-phosphate deaminase
VKLHIFPTPADAARALAREIAAAVAHQPALVLGLPTGRTPIPLYSALVSLYRRGSADFSRVTTFNLDEFVGVPPSDRRSYRAFMNRHLFDRVNVDRRRIHFLDGTAADLQRECVRYERAIRRAGGIDLLILGLGANGHIGFNEPGATLFARTHRARLAAPTRRANAALFGHTLAAVPREGLSMGMATILEARRIVLLATGKGKARSVRRAIGGPVTERVPASFLQLHSDVDVWLDRDAAGAIRRSG